MNTVEYGGIRRDGWNAVASGYLGSGITCFKSRPAHRSGKAPVENRLANYFKGRRSRRPLPDLPRVVRDKARGSFCLKASFSDAWHTPPRDCAALYPKEKRWVTRNLLDQPSKHTTSRSTSFPNLLISFLNRRLSGKTSNVISDLESHTSQQSICKLANFDTSDTKKSRSV